MQGMVNQNITCLLKFPYFTMCSLPMFIKYYSFRTSDFINIHFLHASSLNTSMRLNELFFNWLSLLCKKLK